MSSMDNITVAGIKLNTDQPTDVAMHRLFGWVIWQFPQPQDKGYLGAVRPPEAGYEWLPAVIRADKNRVKVYGNVEKIYPTPEEALEYFNDIKSNA
jgi:hypothetical protein